MNHWGEALGASFRYNNSTKLVNKLPSRTIAAQPNPMEPATNALDYCSVDYSLVF